MNENNLYQLPISVPTQVCGWVGDKHSTGGGKELPIFYPAIEKQILVLLEDDAPSVNIAVKIARRAFDKGS